MNTFPNITVELWSTDEVVEGIYHSTFRKQREMAPIYVMGRDRPADPTRHGYCGEITGDLELDPDDFAGYTLRSQVVIEDQAFKLDGMLVSSDEQRTTWVGRLSRSTQLELPL